MNKILLGALFVSMSLLMLHGETIKIVTDKKIKQTQKHLQEQMRREKKYAKEQRFYQGKDYNFSAVKVDQSDLDAIPVIEPEDDFDMSDVYRDDI